ncbi:hypothetical protein V7068_03950 [Bacillus sp. JJ634]
MMNYYETLIKRLEDENSRVDTTKAQKEANQWRIRYLQMTNRPKKSSETPYVRIDAVRNALTKPGYTCAPNRILGQ